MDIVELMREVIIPALEAKFHRGEITAISVRQRGGTIHPFQLDDLTFDLHVTAVGEEFNYEVFSRETMGELTAERVRVLLEDQLFDFISESRFGWGERR